MPQVGNHPADSFTYTVSALSTRHPPKTGYTLTATGKTGTRNAGCTLTLNQANTRTISGGISLWRDDHHGKYNNMA